MYKLKIDNKNETTSILRIADGASIPLIADNTDYQAFLRWCEEGNTPEQAD